MKKRLSLAAIVLLLSLGAGMLAYPGISNYVNQRNGSRAIQVLADTLAETDGEAIERHRTLAQAYNRWLRDPQSPCPGEYETILDFGNGVMGSLQIPRIGVCLPIGHGTGEQTLAVGLGHLSQSAFPLGGAGNHAAIVGHTGLPSAKMLDDLVKLEEGDLFHISILGQTLSYRVDRILVVEPWDSGPLAPVPGEDLCTLVTCTPYGVNSHRLLVRGTREEAPVQAVSTAGKEPAGVPGIWYLSLCTALLLGAGTACGLLIRRIYR